MADKQLTRSTKEEPGSVGPEPRPGLTMPSALSPAGTLAPGVDLVFIVTKGGLVRFVNRDLGGVNADDVAGTSFYDWVFPEQRAAVREQLDRVFASGEPQAVELMGIHPHSPDTWYECRMQPNLRASEVVSVTVVARDVTHHRRAQQEWERRYGELLRGFEERAADLARANAALAEIRSERDADAERLTRFRALMDAAGEAIFITEPDSGKILDLNETACRWLRSKQEDLVGRLAKQLDLGFPIVLQEDQEIQFTETRDTRRPVMVSGVHRRQDGSTFPVEAAIARHSFGDQTYVLAVVRDAKGRAQGEELLKQREQVYHDLFESTSDAVYLTTRTGQIVAVNQAAVDLFGYSREEFTRLDARQLFPRVEDIRRFQRQMADKGAAVKLEVDLRTKDGTIIPGILSATRRHGADGAVQGYQCLVRRRVESARPNGEEAPAAGVADAGIVLVLDADPQARRHMVELLQQAGIQVLMAERMAIALEILRQNAGRVTAVTLGVEQGEAGVEHLIEEFQRIDPSTTVIVCSAEDRLALASRLPGTGSVAYLERKPHPLALIQKVRAAAQARHGS